MSLRKSDELGMDAVIGGKNPNFVVITYTS